MPVTICVLVGLGQPQASLLTLGVNDSDGWALVIALETLLDQLLPPYGFAVAYCAPASIAWLSLICCEKARPRSTTGVNMARKTGVARPNSTADMPLRSRASAPIRARHGRNAAASQ